MASLNIWPILPSLSCYFSLLSASLSQDIFLHHTIQWPTCLVAPLWMESKKKIKMSESKNWYSNKKVWHFHSIKSFGLKHHFWMREVWAHECLDQPTQLIFFAILSVWNNHGACFETFRWEILSIKEFPEENGSSYT